MRCSLLPKEVQNFLPIKFMFIAEMPRKRLVKNKRENRFAENVFYKAKATYCNDNYRRTSKLNG